jgi:hypothetical protein
MCGVIIIVLQVLCPCLCCLALRYCLTCYAHGTNWCLLVLLKRRGLPASAFCDKSIKDASDMQASHLPTAALDGTPLPPHSLCLPTAPPLPLHPPRYRTATSSPRNNPRDPLPTHRRLAPPRERASTSLAQRLTLKPGDGVESSYGL